MRSGRGDGQPGRQNTPMVVTAYKEVPGLTADDLVPELIVRQPIDRVCVFHTPMMGISRPVRHPRIALTRPSPARKGRG